MQLVAYCCFSYQRSLRYMIHDKIMYIIFLRRVFYEHHFSVEQHIVCIEGLLQWAFLLLFFSSCLCFVLPQIMIQRFGYDLLIHHSQFW